MRNSRFVTRALAFLLCILPVMTDAAAQEGCDPLADSAAMVVSGKVRFTVLTSRMIRIQYSNTSKFEDRATFAIVNQYEGERTIYHFDMYRIERVEEALDFGSEEYLSSGELCLVEWPEKIEPLLPDDTMVVKIEILSPTARRFVIRQF